jgi:hypothetical protein
MAPAITAALVAAGMGLSHPAHAGGPCYMLQADSLSVVFICLETPRYQIVTPRGYFDIAPGFPSEFIVQISDGLWSKAGSYTSGKREGARDDRQAVIDLVKAAKDLKQKRKLLVDPSVRQYCLTSGLAAPLNPSRFPPDPGTDVTYAFADDPAHPEQRITDPDVRAAIVDGLDQMNKAIYEKLPGNVPRMSPLPSGSHDAPSITIRLGKPSEFKDPKDQMIAQLLTKRPTGAWKTGEIIVNPDTRIYKDKDFQGLSIAATHEGGHVYGLEHAARGVMDESTSEDFDFFNFHKEITCMVAQLYIYYKNL